MSTTLSLGSRPHRAGVRQRLGALVFVVVVALASVGTERLVREPAFVDHVTLHNPTDYLVDVRVTDGRGEGWVELAVLEPHLTVATRAVLDQGHSWRFEVRASGVKGAMVRRTRAELERSRWRVVVPDSVVQRFQQARIPLAPR